VTIELMPSRGHKLCRLLISVCPPVDWKLPADSACCYLQTEIVYIFAEKGVALMRLDPLTL
jgi:hypothetical protein